MPGWYRGAWGPAFDPFDAAANTQRAWEVSRGGTDWSDWRGDGCVG